GPAGYDVLRAIGGGPGFAPLTAQRLPASATRYVDRGITLFTTTSLTVSYQVQVRSAAGTVITAGAASIMLPPTIRPTLSAPARRGSSLTDLPLVLSQSTAGTDRDFVGLNLDVTSPVPVPFVGGATIEITNSSQPSRSLPPTAIEWNGATYSFRYFLGNA